MKLSFLMPSRGRPALCIWNAARLLSFAKKPESVEVVIRLDEDDPTLCEWTEWKAPENVRFVVGEHCGGYGHLNVFYEDCARIASGDLLVLYNDDFTMETSGFDELIAHNATDLLAPMILRIANGDSPTSKPSWSCSVISRQIYNILGEICPGQCPNYDRAWEAVGKHLGKVLTCDAVVRHKFEMPRTGDNERSEFIAHKESHRAEFVENWRRNGVLAAQKLLNAK